MSESCICAQGEVNEEGRRGGRERGTHEDGPEVYEEEEGDEDLFLDGEDVGE